MLVLPKSLNFTLLGPVWPRCDSKMVSDIIGGAPSNVLGLGYFKIFQTAIVRLRVHFSRHCDFNQLSDLSIITLFMLIHVKEETLSS